MKTQTVKTAINKPTTNLGKSGFTLSTRLMVTGLISVSGLMSVSNLSHAQVNESKCSPALIAQQQTISPAKNVSQDSAKQINANSLVQTNEQTYLLKGNTVLTQPGLVVLSDEVTHNQATAKTELKGNVELHQKDLIVTASHATIDDNTAQATLENTQYQLLPSRAYGESKNIKLDQNQQTTTLESASLTNCKTDADGNKDWNIKFDSLQVNEQTRRVVGKNTTFYIKDVPVFYTPYFDYPLDDRATGLLFPEFGSYKSLFDDSRYQFAKIPYYFNIAPNMDDTLTLIPITERGLAIDNEFRYLAKHNDVLHSAEITLTALQDNKVNSQGLVSLDNNGDLQYGKQEADRWRVKLNAKQQWNPQLSSQIKWQETSDEVFFKDIPVEEQLKNASYEARYARLDYRVGNFKAHARVLSYMQLMNFADNYEKRPELGLSYYKNAGPLDFDFSAELSDFYVPASNHTRAEGVRFHLEPQLSHTIQKSYGYLTTTAKAYVTQYQMDDNGYNLSTKSAHSRFIPQIAVRGGLIFEKPLKLFGQDYTQTLEPEVQYLETPYLNQSDLALFDTTNRSLAFENLFALNRFSGVDRIGDTRQVSYALNTRLLNKNGKQVVEAGIGQIAYLKNRKVQLDNSATQTKDYSDVFVKLGLNYGNWYFASNSQYDAKEVKVTNANSRIKWQNSEHLAMLNHSVYDVGTADEIDMLSMAISSRINSRWNAGLYTSYNLKQRSLYESQFNLNYRSCCWSSSIIFEKTQLTNGLYNDSIYIQFELDGISTSRNRVNDAVTEKLNF